MRLYADDPEPDEDAEADADDATTADAVAADASGAARPARPRDPLHGVTLQQMLIELSAALGWPAMAAKVPVRCFTHEPSVASSLKFLRRTPWARARVESLYASLVRRQQRGAAP